MGKHDKTINIRVEKFNSINPIPYGESALGLEVDISEDQVPIILQELVSKFGLSVIDEWMEHFKKQVTNKQSKKETP